MPTPTQIVEINCRHIWKELTNYMEGDLTPEIRDRITHHLQGCKHCTATPVSAACVAVGPSSFFSLSNSPFVDLTAGVGAPPSLTRRFT